MSSARWALSHSPDPTKTNQAHEALKAEPMLWDRLAFGGFLEGVGAVYEQRICPACEAALAVPADAGRVLFVHAALARVTALSLEAVLGAQTRLPLAARPVVSAGSDPHAAAVPHPIVTDGPIRSLFATAGALTSSVA